MPNGVKVAVAGTVDGVSAEDAVLVSSGHGDVLLAGDGGGGSHTWLHRGQEVLWQSPSGLMLLGHTAVPGILGRSMFSLLAARCCLESRLASMYRFQ